MRCFLTPCLCALLTMTILLCYYLVSLFSHAISFTSFRCRRRTITITNIQRLLSALAHFRLCSSGGLQFPRLRRSGDVLCRPVWWSNRWSMQHCRRYDGNSHGKPQQWQVLRRLFYPMAHCRLHEHSAASKLRHYVLHHPVGVLQGCVRWTDK